MLMYNPSVDSQQGQGLVNLDILNKKKNPHPSLDLNSTKDACSRKAYKTTQML